MDKTNIVQGVAALFRAAGFEVREYAGDFAIVGSMDAAGILVDSVLEHIEHIEHRLNPPLPFDHPALAPQADSLRKMPPGPAAETMDHAQLAALGAMIRQKG